MLDTMDRWVLPCHNQPHNFSDAAFGQGCTERSAGFLQIGCKPQFGQVWAPCPSVFCDSQAAQDLCFSWWQQRLYGRVQLCQAQLSPLRRNVQLPKASHMTKCQLPYGGRKEGWALIEQWSNPPQITLNAFLFSWEVIDLIDKPGEIGRGPGQATSMVMKPVIMAMIDNIDEGRMLD